MEGFEVNDGFGVAPAGDCKTFELADDAIQGEKGRIEVAVSYAEALYKPVGQSLDALDVGASDEFSAGANDAVNLGYGALLIGEYMQAVHREDDVGGIGCGQTGYVGAAEADVFEAVLPETLGGLLSACLSARDLTTARSVREYQSKFLVENMIVANTARSPIEPIRRA